MKKGDIIQKRVVIESGKKLIGNLSSMQRAEESFHEVYKYWSLPHEPIAMNAGVDQDNPGNFAVFLAQDTYEMKDAKVSWVVDHEVAIEYKDGGCSIVNILEDTGWVVIKEAAPEYQSSVEHMTDEQLRESIDALRMQRISRPEPTRMRKTTTSAPKESKEDKALASVLKNKTPEEMLELQRKLGLID